MGSPRIAGIPAPEMSEPRERTEVCANREGSAKKDLDPHGRHASGTCKSQPTPARHWVPPGHAHLRNRSYIVYCKVT